VAGIDHTWYQQG